MPKRETTKRLTYVGPDPAVVGVVPLPEGWPAADHEELNEALAAEKVASGYYKGDAAAPVVTEDE